QPGSRLGALKPHVGEQGARHVGWRSLRVPWHSLPVAERFPDWETVLRSELSPCSHQLGDRQSRSCPRGDRLSRPPKSAGGAEICPPPRYWFPWGSVFAMRGIEVRRR